MKRPILSICIPTYNRATFLGGCLESLARLDSKYWEDIEVIVSDNASTDSTREVVESYQQLIPLRYFRNASNIGGERNFFAAASRGLAEHVWVFGDDDKFEEDGVASVLEQIRLGYDLIVLNFCVWSRDMDSVVHSRGFPRTVAGKYQDPNAVLASLGSHLGFISSVIVRKEMFLSVPPEEYEQFVEYGFSHLYATYCGIRSGCRAICLPDPMFKCRGDNCEGFKGEAGQSTWNKYFIEGTALVFEALGRKGYSTQAVAGAKNQVLRDFVAKAILGAMQAVNRPALLRSMYPHYRGNWRFWAICVPGLLAPMRLLNFAHDVYVFVRRKVRSFSRGRPLPTTEPECGAGIQSERLKGKRGSA